MAPRQVTLHLDPVRSMMNLLIVIDVLARKPGVTYADYAAILCRIREDYDFTVRTEPLSLARLLGLLEGGDGKICLSHRATVIASMRPAVRADALHYLLATAWHQAADAALGCAWAYRAFCDRLWLLGDVELNASEKRHAVADLLDAAQKTFPELRLAALSVKSVLGMRKWLEMLEPPVICGHRFRRRETCSPELMLLAIGQVAKEDGASCEVDLLLTPARRAAICRLCLLEPAALDKMLDHSISTFPVLVEPGTRAGTYGRFVRLKAFPTIEDLGVSRS